jgi:hypothetical protein
MGMMILVDFDTDRQMSPSNSDTARLHTCWHVVGDLVTQ